MIISFSYLFKQDEASLYKIGVIGKSAHKVKLTQWVQYEDLELAKQKLRFQKIDLLVDYTSNPLKYWKSKKSPKSTVVEALWVQALAPEQQVSLSEIKGQNLSYVDWLFPGLLSMNVAMMSLWGIGWVIVRQRKLGVLKRFKASPMTALEYLTAQLLSRMLIVAITGAIVFIGANIIHPFPMEGSYFDLIVLYLVGCASLSSIGLVMAARMSSDELANGLLNIIIYPMIFLSEIWFSLEGSPQWVIDLSRWVPLWHLTQGVRAILYEGKSLTQLMPSVIILLSLGLVFTWIGAKTFKWNKE
jgi:ABC-type multidrug transport system permease subunit